MVGNLASEKSQDGIESPDDLSSCISSPTAKKKSRTDDGHGDSDLFCIDAEDASAARVDSRRRGSWYCIVVAGRGVAWVDGRMRMRR